MNDVALTQLLDTKEGWDVEVAPKAPSGKAWLLADHQLRAATQEIHKFVRKKNLFVLVITGATGAGKSTIEQQIGHDIDTNFTIDNVCMDNTEILKRLAAVPFHSCICYDEGTLGLNSREAMSVGNRTLLKAIHICRDKVRGIIIICVPNYFNLDTAIRTDAINGLILVKDREHFFYFTGRSARAIGVTKKWSAGKPRFFGSFSKHIAQAKEYEDKKLASVSRWLKKSVKLDMFTAAEVARQLNVSKGVVLRAIKTGILPAIEGGTIGQQVRYLVKPGDVFKLRIKLRPSQRRQQHQRKTP